MARLRFGSARSTSCSQATRSRTCASDWSAPGYCLTSARAGSEACPPAGWAPCWRIVRALARAGHTVYAGIRQVKTRNAHAAADLNADAHDAGLDLRPIELDISDQDSVDSAIDTIVAEQGRLDVIVHNAGHMVLGPAEAFTSEQVAEIYDVNVLGAQRVNRAALPHLRKQGSGLLVWVGSSSTRGGCPPFLAPYFAAKAAMDALAVSYAGELIRFGIGTSIVVPGAFTSGTNHFAHAGSPADNDRESAYEEHYGTLRSELGQRLAALIPPEADAGDVASEIARIVDLPTVRCPFGPTSTPAVAAAQSYRRSPTGSAPSSTTA
jgi:NAD(P)-dependent dehydrogenase (short-subunit alcohol dehydrogenase family)